MQIAENTNLRIMRAFQNNDKDCELITHCESASWKVNNHQDALTHVVFEYRFFKKHFRIRFLGTLILPNVHLLNMYINELISSEIKFIFILTAAGEKRI